MIRNILLIGITLAISTFAHGQGTTASLAADTYVSAQLQSTLDVSKANVGDKVLLKTTQAVKQDGQVVIKKGATLVGHVTDVARRTKHSTDSHVNVLFDSVTTADGTVLPVSASIISVTSADVSASDDDGMMDSGTTMGTGVSPGMSTSARTSASASAGGGGLLGGVGNTVGNTVHGTTNTVGRVANSTTSAVGGVTRDTVNTTGSAVSNIRGLNISQSTNASASGGSTLSMSGGNLKLDRGTNFDLDLTQTTKVGVK